ncbi:hypothetical protein LINPERPRIM_LOCUS30415 [Linum perenne]
MELRGKDAQNIPKDGDELASRRPTVQPVCRRPRFSCSKVKEHKFIKLENKMCRHHKRSSEDLVIRMTWTSEYLPYDCKALIVKINLYFDFHCN